MSLSTIWLRATAGDAAGSSAMRAIGLVNAGLVLLIAIGLLLKLWLVFSVNVNWDELFYLSQVHQYLRGELTQPFQTFHVHLFRWLPLVAEGEVPQIMAARLVMYTLALGCCVFTYRIARQFLNPSGALFAVLAYLAVSNLLEQGTSFRVDPTGAFLFLASLYLLLHRRGTWRAAAAGLLMALSMMVSIKAAIHLATIGAVFLVLLISSEQRRQLWVQIVVFGLSLVVGFGLLYELHHHSLPAGAPAEAGRFAVVTADKMFMKHGLLPRWMELRDSLYRNPVVWTLMTLGLAILAGDANRSREARRHQLLLLGAFFIPLLSILAYRNAYPYFYVFALAPAIVASGVVIDNLARLVQAKSSRWAMAEICALTAAVFISLVVHYRTNAADGTVAQRQIIDAVHEMFPEPVPYIDAVSMIATFPRVGFFMSTWGMEAYRRDGRAVLAETISEQAPVFLVTDNYALFDAMRGTDRAAPEYSLFPADRLALTQNYIRHWGIVYVAGKVLEFTTPTPAHFDLLIPGPYTVEAAADVTIDGVRYAPGQVLHLERGSHVLAPVAAPATVTLRWGDHLFRPTEALSPEKLFVFFR